MDKMACSWCGKTPVVLQRLTDQTYFCSSQCFVNAWPGHSAQHRTGLTGSKGTGDKYVPGQSNGPEASTEQKWIEVANTMSYTPQHEDIGHTLKLACTPYHPDGTKGIAKTLKTNYVIAPPLPPPPRRMLIVRNNVVVSAGKPGTFRTNMNRLGFTMLTYNCLAEIYATSEAYPYCPAWALPWNYRRRNILRELVAYHADVMCLQEVQADHFENFLEPELAKYSYAGLHKCKTREFMGQYGKMDGCAIFYRRDKFTLLPGGSLEVEFNAIARARHGNDKRLLNRLLRDNVAQVVALEVNMAAGQPPGGRRQLCVANTHINAAVEFSDVKLWQTQHLLLEVERMMTQVSGSINNLPLVVAGDFNSLPGSDPHILLSSGGVQVQDEQGLLAGALLCTPNSPGTHALARSLTARPSSSLRFACSHICPSRPPSPSNRAADAPRAAAALGDGDGRRAHQRIGRVARAAEDGAAVHQLHRAVCRHARLHVVHVRPALRRRAARDGRGSARAGVDGAALADLLVRPRPAPLRVLLQAVKR